MRRSHPLTLVFLSASAALAPGCAQILGDYDVTAGSAGATSLNSSSAVTSSGAGGSSAGGAPGSVSVSASAGGGGQGDGGQLDTGTDPCGADTTEAFKDDFSSPLTGIPWDNYTEALDHVVAKEANGVLTITTDGFVPDGNDEAFAGLLSKGNPLSLVSCHVAIKVTNVNVNDDMAVRFELINDSDPTAVKTLRISVVGSDLIFHDYLNGNANGTDQNQQHLNYDPKAHAWWRFREAQGKVLSETSIDGKAWYSRYSINTPGFAKAVRVNLTMGSKLLMQTMGSVTFDNLNTPPP